MSDDRLDDKDNDTYQYGEDQTENRRRRGFGGLIDSGMEAARKGIDVGALAVTEVNQTVRNGQIAKAEAEVRKAEAEARAQQGLPPLYDEYHVHVEYDND